MDKLIPFITAEKIDAVIKEMGRRISLDYERLLERDDALVVIVTLKGAFLFAADLLRYLTVPVNVDFIRAASYGVGTKSSGNVRIVKDIEASLQAKHVLLLDEIVDTGRTLKFLLDRFSADNPKSLKTAALLSKPSCHEVTVPVDYLGLEVENKFLVGYGLDYAEKYRNLRDILYVDQA